MKIHIECTQHNKVTTKSTCMTIKFLSTIKCSRLNTTSPEVFQLREISFLVSLVEFQTYMSLTF